MAMNFKPKNKSASSVKTTTKPQSSPSSKVGTKTATKPNVTKPSASRSGKPAPSPKAKPASTPKAAPKKTSKPTTAVEAYEIPDYSEGIEIAEGTKPTFDPGGAISTPTGTAMWAWVGTKADSAFNKEPEQKITVVFNQEDPELEGFFNRILAFQNAWFAANGEEETDSVAIFKDPDDAFVNKWNEALGEDAPEPGPRIEFRRKAKFNGEDAIPVPTFTAEGEEEPLQIWPGDQVKVEFSLGGYNSPSKSIGCGIKAYLRAVQLIEEGPRIGQGGGGKSGSTFKKTGNTKATRKQEVADEEIEESGEDLPF